jgi:hypothetical protein
VLTPNPTAQSLHDCAGSCHDIRAQTLKQLSVVRECSGQVRHAPSQSNTVQTHSHARPCWVQAAMCARRCRTMWTATCRGTSRGTRLRLTSPVACSSCTLTGCDIFCLPKHTALCELKLKLKCHTVRMYPMHMEFCQW